MRIKIKKIIPTFIGLLLLLIACWLQITNRPQVQEWRDRIDNTIYDIQLRTSLFKPKLDNTIVIVDIDDNSLKKEGRWPWPREKLAALNMQLKKLGAVVIAYDMFFPEPEENVVDAVITALQNKRVDSTVIHSVESIAPQFNGDVKFEQSLSQVDSILGYTFHDDLRAGEGVLPSPLLTLKTNLDNLSVISKTNYSANIAVLQNAAKSGGFINVFPDSDGVIRRVPLVILYGNSLYPSLALSAVQAYLLSSSRIVWVRVGNRWVIDNVILGKQVIPVDDVGQVLIPFTGTLGPAFSYYSAGDVLEQSNKIPNNAFAGKLVFVGVTAPGLGDLKTTPLSGAFPGVEIHALIARGILQNNFHYVPAWTTGAQLLLLLFIGVIFSWLFPRLSPVWLATIAILTPLLIFMLDKILYLRSGIVLAMTIPTALVIALAIFNMAYGYLTEERHRRELRDVFGQYVPPAYIEELLQHKHTFESETREMTVLFSDIRNFTTIAESMSAGDIKSLLNQFFTPMTRIIFEHKGTIDKYVGDMIMAFWGAPLSDPKHAQNALAAALEMRAMVEKLKTDFAEQQLPLIDIGIGINTGPMSVGDMGSQYRRAYTVIGDAVNLASRLETLTKTYASGIIVGEETQKLCKDEFVFREIDRVLVKGKTKPVTIFELIGHVSKPL